MDIDPDWIDPDVGGSEDELQPLIPSTGEDIPLETLGHRRTTTSQIYGERSSNTAETSFIDGGNVVRDPRILLTNEKLQETYPNYGKKGFLTLKTVAGRDGNTKVVVVGPKGGETALFTKDGTISSKIPKASLEILGPTREALMRENAQMLREVEDRISHNEEVANDRNEDKDVRERAAEDVNEGNRRRSELENEREQLEEGMSLRERIRNIFRKYGFTVAAVALAVGTTIGVIINALKKGLKTVASGVGNGLKDLGKKVAALLPGLLGSIANFVFQSAGEVVKFLGENAWLLILAVAAFFIDRRTKS